MANTLRPDRGFPKRPKRSVRELYEYAKRVLQPFDARESEPGCLRARCIAHGGRDDRNLAVWIDPVSGSLCVKCHSKGCSTEEIKRALGIWEELGGDGFGVPLDLRKVPTARLPAKRSEPEAAALPPIELLPKPEGPYGPEPKLGVQRWLYTGEYGSFWIERTSQKDFQSRPKGEMPEELRPKLTKSGIPKAPLLRPLLNLPAIQAANRDTDLVIIPEGEKCFEVARARIKGVATTFSGGAGSWKLTDYAPLAGFHVLLCADADDGGRACMQGLAELLHPHVQSIRMLPAEGNGKDDIADWDADGTLGEKLAAATLYTGREPAKIGFAGSARRLDGGRLELLDVQLGSLQQAIGFVGLEYRQNVRARRGEMRTAGGDWEVIDRRKEAIARANIERVCRVSVKDKNKNLVLRAIRPGNQRFELARDGLLGLREVDPVLEYLKALPAWDTVPRLLKLLGELFGCNVDPNTAEGRANCWAGAYMFDGYVKRALLPGYKLDTVPVLVGDQGIGKSSFIRGLLPPELVEYYARMMFGRDIKRIYETLIGKAIIELDEMAGVHGADLEFVKGILSSQGCNVRLSYRRDPKSYLWQCIVIGSTNNRACLPNDPSGNRRWMPIICPGGTRQGVVAYLDKNRDQLLAESFHRVDTLELQVYFPDELAPEQAQWNEGFRKADESIEGMISRKTWDGDFYTLEEIAVAAGALPPNGGTITRKLQNRLMAALQQPGRKWTRRQKRIGGKNTKGWCPPKAITTECNRTCRCNRT